MLDFKKEQKELYLPKTTPSIIDVPAMTFLAVDGAGDPNTSEEYAHAIELLYGLSYAIKMGNKEILQYVVGPLEGFWSVTDEFFDAGPINKDAFTWTAVIRQPDFVDGDVVENAKAALAKKKPHLDGTKARLEEISEELCVHAMHLGSYDDEPATIATMEQFAVESGYDMDVSDVRRHHEIYLSDPRKVAPEKLKTIIRLPIV
ncbi:MAG: GyrI-like domain-containing protein [Coriobacteriia bacterium]|nr:GyrI-like domain-containing protein [Coriobacteriia bacterium]